MKERQDLLLIKAEYNPALRLILNSVTLAKSYPRLVLQI